MPALFLGKTFLWAVAGPVVMDYPGTGCLGDFHGAVGGARVDHHDVVAELLRGTNHLPDPAFLVTGDDENRKRERRCRFRHEWKLHVERANRTQNVLNLRR